MSEGCVSTGFMSHLPVSGEQPVVPLPERDPAAIRAAVARLDPAALARFEADHGFDRLLFADALGALTQITDAAFAEYRTDPGTISDMRHRLAQWRRELLEADSR
jgi:hypothetical protein